MDEDLRAFLTNEGGRVAELVDLPRQWDRLQSEADRTRVLHGVYQLAFTKSWAREGLQRLMKMLLDRGEPIPPILQCWANDYAAGRRRPLRRNQKDERDIRIAFAMHVLRDEGHTYEAAKNEIADALELTDEAVKSVLRKVKRDPALGVKKDTESSP